MNASAWDAGFRSGNLDYLIGHRSEYAWLSFGTESEYHEEYSRGYRAGWSAAARDSYFRGGR